MIVTEFVSQLQTVRSKNKQVIGYINIILLYNILESCTTFVVLATPDAMDLDDINARMSSCFQDYKVSDHEDPKKPDPFCLYRSIIAQTVDNVRFTFRQLDLDIVRTANNTYEHIGNPDELKDRTLAIFAHFSDLRLLTRTMDYLEYSLKAMSAGSSLLLEKLGPACTVSQAASASDDTDCLQGYIHDMRTRVSFLDKTNDDFLTFVR